MANARIRSRTSGLSLDLEWDGFDRTERAFRDVRNQLTRDLSELERDVAEREVLPDVRRRAAKLKVAGTPVAGTLVVRRRRAAPYITTTMRGKRGRAVGLQEFGGRVATPILPRRKHALTVNGNVVASVRTVRHYRGGLFMQHGAAFRLGAFGETVRDEIVERYFRVYFEIR